MRDKLSQLHIHVPQKDWRDDELASLLRHVTLIVNGLGGADFFSKHIGNVKIEKADTGSNGALAYNGRIELSSKHPFTAWTVAHELAHVWDARHDWQLSVALEKYTGGFTAPQASASLKADPTQWDAGALRSQPEPGRYGRKPGCNAAGYFYGDKPSGSNWNFNRKEDFAESVVMYLGWGKDNELSPTAHGRITRYLLANGTKDPLYNIIDNWADYAPYFYPTNGDYTKTKRWQFIDDLLHDKIQVK